jgi:hypothetical protein
MKSGKDPCDYGDGSLILIFFLLLQRAETSMSLIPKYFLKTETIGFFENSNNPTTLTKTYI